MRGKRTTMTRPTDILREYGNAVRGDWMDIDSQGVRDDLNTIATFIEDSGNGEMLPNDAISLRKLVGICQNEKGNWKDYCDSSCTEE